MEIKQQVVPWAKFWAWITATDLGKYQLVTIFKMPFKDFPLQKFPVLITEPPVSPMDLW